MDCFSLCRHSTIRKMTLWLIRKFWDFIITLCIICRYDGMLVGDGEGEGGRVDRSIPHPLIGLPIKYEPPTRPRSLSNNCCGWWVIKRKFRDRFGPNLALRLEAGTKLNKKSNTIQTHFRAFLNS